MTLPISEFIERLLQHVPKPNSLLVRSWGLYSQRQKEDLEACRKMLNQPPVEEPETVLWQDCFKNSDIHPELCPVCGKALIPVKELQPMGRIPRSGRPPPKTYLKEAA